MGYNPFEIWGPAFMFEAKAKPKASPRGQAIAKAAARARARPPPHLQHRSIEVWLALCAKLMWDDGRFAACFQQQYLYHASEPAALYGDGNMLRATWWSGTASALTPGHASSSQPQESFHAKMKRDLKSLEPLQDHMALVTMLERCVNLRLGCMLSFCWPDGELLLGWFLGY